MPVNNFCIVGSHDKIRETKKAFDISNKIIKIYLCK